MNFSTYKKKLIESIESALSENKYGIIKAFRLILRNANSLFKTKKFNFWLEQIGTIEFKEIPITYYGLNEAKIILKSLKESLPNNKNLQSSIEMICERLFTYSTEEDLCQRQSEFHYYFHLPSGIVFKESELGMLEPKIDIKSE